MPVIKAVNNVPQLVFASNDTAVINPLDTKSTTPMENGRAYLSPLIITHSSIALYTQPLEFGPHMPIE